MMRVLDLFSGIGGFSLGLERAGGFKTVAFCEIEPFCRRVLRRHWPDAQIYEDVRTIPSIGGVDVVCGGFPCQPFSSAARGRGAGAQSDRNLWPAMRAVIQHERPAWVIGENVVNIDRLAGEQVVSDLETLGYEVAPPLEIPACAVGRDHWRARLWFLGHSDRDRKPIVSLDEETSGLPRRGFESGGSRTKNGISSRLDRVRALGNAVVPHDP
jgi:DNA (cytosine-5)-methyltransferase 1